MCRQSFYTTFFHVTLEQIASMLFVCTHHAKKTSVLRTASHLHGRDVRPSRSRTQLGSSAGNPGGGIYV